MSLLETFAKRTSTSLEKIAASVSIAIALYFGYHLLLDLVFSQDVFSSISLSMLFTTGDRQIEFIIIFIVTGALIYISEPYEKLIRWHVENFYRHYILRSDDEEKYLTSFSHSFKQQIVAVPIFSKGFYRIYSEYPTLGIHFNKVVGHLYLLHATILFSVEIIGYAIFQLAFDPAALSTNRFVILFLILLFPLIIYSILISRNFKIAKIELQRNGLVTLQAYTLYHQTGSNEQLMFVQNGQWTQIRRNMVNNLASWRVSLSRLEFFKLYLADNKAIFDHEKSTSERLRIYFYLAKNWGLAYQLKKQSKPDNILYETLPKLFIGTKEVDFYLVPMIDFFDYILAIPDEISNDSGNIERSIKWMNNKISSLDRNSQNKILDLLIHPIMNDSIPFTQLSEVTFENIDSFYQDKFKHLVSSLFSKDQELPDIHHFLTLVLRQFIMFSLVKLKCEKLLVDIKSLESIIGI